MSKADKVTINFGNEISLKQAATIIAANPDIRYIIRGNPGIGKSSITKMLSTMLDNYRMVYFDCTNKDLGDVGFPVPDHENKVMRYFLNAGLELHHNDDKHLCIVLDEFTKAPRPIQNMLHPMLEINKPRIGDVFLPEGTIVILTGNLTENGVGDNLAGHTQNRVVELIVRNPTADELITWGIDNNMEPTIMAFIKQYPHILASATDPGQADNPYIFNPRKTQKGYVSPRSLEIAGKIVSKRHKVDSDSLLAQLIGALGQAGARDLQAFVDYQDKLPDWDSIIKEPMKAKVPEGAGACAVLVYGAVMRVDDASITPFMDYLSRFSTEWEAVFILSMMSNPTKQHIALKSVRFRDWMLNNQDVL